MFSFFLNGKEMFDLFSNVQTTKSTSNAKSNKRIHDAKKQYIIFKYNLSHSLDTASKVR